MTGEVIGCLLAFVVIVAFALFIGYLAERSVRRGAERIEAQVKAETALPTISIRIVPSGTDREA